MLQRPLALLASLWRNLVHADRVARDLDEEVRAAFDLLVDEKLRTGLVLEEARRTAALELGGVEAVKQRVRDGRSGASIDALLQDLRYAVRTLRASPLFTITAVLSLAVGIAGTTAIFSLADLLVADEPDRSQTDVRFSPEPGAQLGRFRARADQDRLFFPRSGEDPAGEKLRQIMVRKEECHIEPGHEVEKENS